MITDEEYPVEYIWVFKQLIGIGIGVVISVTLLLFGYVNYYLVFLILYSPVHFLVSILRWKNFHFTLDEKFMVVKQGVLSKKERNLPYGVIQNVFVKQDLFDRLFKLSSLTIENASEAGGAAKVRQKQVETIGASGNKVMIPGLTSQNAQALKDVILQKMRENPTETFQSGL